MPNGCASASGGGGGFPPRPSGSARRAGAGSRPPPRALVAAGRAEQPAAVVPVRRLRLPRAAGGRMSAARVGAGAVSVVGARLVNISSYGMMIESPVPLEREAVMQFRLVVAGKKA